MPVDQSPAKLSSPSRPRSSAHHPALPTPPAQNNITPSSTSGTPPKPRSAHNNPATKTPRRSARLSTAATSADDASDSRSESSFSTTTTTQPSAPATPATAVSASASNPSSTTRKSRVSAGASPASSSSTLPNAQPTPSRVGTSVSSSDHSAAASSSKPPPQVKGKGKAKATTTSAAANSNPPTASSPSSSAKAKGKRKASSSSQTVANKSLTQPEGGSSSNKRPKLASQPSPSRASSSTSPYPLRSRAKMTGVDSNGDDAPASARSKPGQSKTASKPKRPAAATTRSSNHASDLDCPEASVSPDEDVHMSELPDQCGAHDDVDLSGHDHDMDDHDALDGHDEDEEIDNDEDDDHDLDDGALGGASSRSNALGGFGDEDDDDDDDGEDEDEDDDRGAGVFGLNLRAMAGYMSGLSNRFRSLLTSIRKESDSTAQMVALQDLSELLSVSTEDTLAGYFPTDSFVKELVYILGGPKPERHDVSQSAKIQAIDDDDDGLDEEMKAALAAAAAADMAEDSGEKMLLACRCLANLIEAMPYAAHSVVSLGAIPVLTSKLMEITFIDLAEQVLQTLEKVSQDYPGAIVREGGLNAILQYLDFFNIHIQRTAMTAAANCCRKLTPESLAMVRDVMPIVQNVLTYSDQRLVESACRCVVRVVDSYRLHPDLLEQLLTGELLAALNNLLLPASAATSPNTTLGASTYTDVLKAFGTACRSSPQLAVTLLENNIVETLYHLLTGSPAPAEAAASGNKAEATRPHGVQLESEPAYGPGSAAETAAVAVVPGADAADAGSTVAVADMAVLQNLAQRPKEQIQEALSLIGELLPPLPRDGVFDPRAYTEKAYLKRKSKHGSTSVERESSASPQKTTQAEQTGSETVAARAVEEDSSAAPASSATPAPVRPSSSRSSSTRSKVPRTKSDKEIAREAAQAKHIEMLHRRTAVVKRFTHLVLPTLVEVYAASVALHVRNKAINGILKIISFVEPNSLVEALDNVPLASFLAAILSSREHPTLAVGALQIVELLTDKLPSVYTALLRREGVMWEIDDIASQTPSSQATEKAAASTADAGAALSVQPLTLPRPAASQTAESPADGAGMGLSASSGLARLLAAATGSGHSAAQMEAALGIRTASSSASASAFNAQSSADATDASIWRARVLRDKFAAEANSSGGARSAAQALDHIKDLVERLYAAAADGKETEAVDVLQAVGSLFSRSDEPISSFELLRSGLVEALYSFSTQSDGGIPLERRRRLLIRTLMQDDDRSGQNGATVLVRRLQEALSRLENVDITTALSVGNDEARKSPSAMLGRQLRLRLQAEDATDIPRSCNNIIVTIHAVATFQSLSDYLRPKIAVSSAAAGSGSGAAGSSASSRLSSVLAAFAAATGGSGGFPELGGSKEANAASSADKAKEAAGADKTKTDAASGSGSAAEKAESKTQEGAEGKDAKSSDASGSAQTGKDRESDARAEARALARHLFGDDGRPVEDGEGSSKAKGADATDDELQSDEALARSLMEGLLHGADFDDEEGFSEEEGFDEEILQGEIPVDGETGASAAAGDGTVAADKTINLDVEKEGGRIVAKTPDGTRIATPSNGAGTPKPAEGASSSTGTAAASSSSTPSPSKPSSYASALQKKPSDWHLEFSLGSEKLSLDTTVYGAVHRYEAAQTSQGSGAAATSSAHGHGGGKHIWSNVYTVRYKKVSGAEERAKAESTPEPTSADGAAIELPASIKEDAPYAKLLQLLAVLHSLNMEWREVMRAGAASGVSDAGEEIAPTSTRALTEAAFVNNKLTAKLNRQLEEPIIVASACLPAWSTDLPRHFPFLFPFEARFAFLQSTSFGYARLLTRWQALHSRNQDAGSSASRLDDSFGFLGRLQRQKVRISRANLLASAFKVFELYGSNSSVLEVEYFEEVGTGLGPTLEFYSFVSKEFARRDLELWRDSRSGGSGGDGSAYVFSPQGLFPAPLIPAESDETKPASTSTSGAEGGAGSVQKRLQAYRILGQFVAKALLDSRIIDCNFSPVFMRAVLNQHVAPTLATLSAVDATLARSLASLREMKPEEVDGVGLDFTLPGYEAIELHAGGREEAVTSANVEQYISEVLDMTLHSGIRAAVRAFRQGFNLIFPITAMSSFTAEELVMLFGNTEEDWSEATLKASVKPDHGLNADTATFRDIVAIMAAFDAGERREFLQWLTGSPKLPIGGFGGLHPQLTIVKRPHEAPLTPDDYLPSVMTCVNYLKMPIYSSRDKMRERLHTAMKEGSTSFHLS